MEEVDWIELDQREEVVWSGNPKLNSIYPTLAIGVLFIPLMGLGLIIIAAAYLDLKNTRFLVTNKGVYRKKGVLSRNVKRVKFDKIQNTAYRQTYFGKIFEYGNIDISTAGGSGIEMSFRAVDNPRKVQSLINERIEDGSEQNREIDEDEVLVQILHELKEINEKL